MLYAPLALGTATCSTVGAALMVFKFCRDWDIRVRVSSVRWLFTVFFVYLLAYTISRVVYYCWLVDFLAKADPDVLIVGESERFTVGEIDRLTIHALVHLDNSGTEWLVIIVVLGDIALFASSQWVFALVYELSKLLSLTMDRGAASERAKIRTYTWIGHGCIAVFAAVELLFVLLFPGYSVYSHALLLLIYLMQIASLVYMVVNVVGLKWKGRDKESIHGQFVASPIYRRLKCIMVVYAVFALEFQISSLILYTTSTHNRIKLDYLGASAIIYTSTGLALAVVTGCSLSCVLKAFPFLVPKALHSHMEILIDDAAFAEGAAPITGTFERVGPWVNPVFVFTDIESSSALWAIGDGRTMQKAVQIHDDILRSALTKHRGYEITTAGDSFQLAFHTIREAAAYCLDVQLKLLTAEWPKELHGLVPATSKERQAHRYLFRGLRVRMGIHDANECEGALVVDVHAVTGKTTYTGASEVIASTVGDSGAGGQIVVTRRVAEWLEQNRDLMSERFEVDWLASLDIPQVNINVDLFQILLTQMRGRKHLFKQIEIKREPNRISPARPTQSTSGETWSSSTQFPVVVASPDGSGDVRWSVRPESMDHILPIV